MGTQKKRKYQISNWAVVTASVGFHFLFLFAMVDIYFRTFIVHGIDPVEVSEVSPSKRIVVFIADGLPVNEAFKTPTRMKFLRNVIETRGFWGVSHAHVPTESRPGHVALLSGFYEDVSAVSKGWKSNTEEFDSIFNRSSSSWGFGSPDIIPMFSDSVPHMHGQYYSAEMEDLKAFDASDVDRWVLNKAKILFEEASIDENLKKQISKDKSIFFFHFLGLDSLGHSVRPGSEIYMDGVSTVNDCVEEIHELFELMFPDESTSYIFTSDHGMTSFGSHGDGSIECTQTPLIGWGAGLRNPIPSKYLEDQFSPKDWELDSILRKDIEQADLVPLMASLIGIPIPVNSVGVLPSGLLDVGIEFETQCLLRNFKQVLGQYQHKNELKQNARYFFTQFSHLEDSKPEKYLEIILNHINNGNYAEAQSDCRRYIDLCLEGLSYLQTYDRPFLFSAVILGYVGWIIFVCLFVLKKYSSYDSIFAFNILDLNFFSFSRLFFLVFSNVLFAIMFLQSFPVLYYLYCLPALIFWGQSWDDLWILKKLLFTGTIKEIIMRFLLLICICCVAEMMVLTYFYREALSCVFFVLSFFPLFVQGWKSKLQSSIWFFSCNLLALFPLIPLDFGENFLLVFWGAVILLCMYCVLFFVCVYSDKSLKLNRPKLFCGLLLFEFSLIFFALYATWNTEASFKAKLGLPRFNQIITWILSFICILLNVLNPLIQIYISDHFFLSLLCLSLSLSPLTIVLSINFEVFLFAALILNLFSWIFLERNRLLILRRKKGNHIDLSHDVWASIMYLLYFYLTFFGTGNIASVSSFQLASCYRFVTVFSPFIFASLLLVKLLVPMHIVSYSFRVIMSVLQFPSHAGFWVVILVSDIMCINFFFLVKDSGSWVDIGQSISHFVIGNIMTIIQLVIFFSSAHVLPRVNTFSIAEIEKRKKRK